SDRRAPAEQEPKIIGEFLLILCQTPTVPEKPPQRQAMGSGKVRHWKDAPVIRRLDIVAQLLQGARKLRGDTAHRVKQVRYSVSSNDHLGCGRQSLIPDTDLPRPTTEAVFLDFAEGLVFAP